MNAFLFLCGGVLMGTGIHHGWASELGRIELCFGFYVICDAIMRSGKS